MPNVILSKNYSYINDAYIQVKLYVTKVSLVIAGQNNNSDKMASMLSIWSEQ